MGSETGGSDPRSPSTRHPAGQPPCHQNPCKAKGSGVAEKPLEGKEETFSSPLRESRTQRQGSEPQTDEEHAQEAELERVGGISGPGASLADEPSVTPGRRTRRTPDGDRGGESEETAGARPRRQGARGAERSGRRRYRSPGDRPPPLRKRLVTALRALSEAIHQDVAQACEQREHSPLTWEQRSGLEELWGPLCAALQTVYTVAHQAAYVFPAESWLVPGPQPSPGGLPRGAEDKPGAAGRV
ncbi:protein FRG2-like [Lutra lutra]|uniref:protein FRG2-like n=1 Tax=Lutra lutra TaxID=9657 RepID=UPI001FD11F78|nr:protein FRG2-like [Lutra lutra]